MHLSWLELTNTRCYETLRFEPADGVNVLIGSNGAGKTSILEAAAYLGLLKSFRGTPDDAIIRNGAAQAVIRGEFGDDSLGGEFRFVEVWIAHECSGSCAEFRIDAGARKGERWKVVSCQTCGNNKYAGKELYSSIRSTLR